MVIMTTQISMMSHLEALKNMVTQRYFFTNPAPAEFLEKYPNKIAIIDATELRTEFPSALQKHSESYRTYKSHATLKCMSYWC